MKTALKLSIVAVICLLDAAGHSLSAQPADAQLNRYFQSYLDRHFQQQPLEATQLGDHRFDHLLEDLTPGSRQQWVNLARQTLNELPRQVKRQQLSRNAQIDYEIFEHHLRRELWFAENTHPFEDDPRIYNNYVSDSVFLLLSQSTLPKETNVAHCLARMARIPAVLAVAKANLKNPPRVVLETAIRQNRGAIGFYENDLFLLAGETRQLSELKTAARKVVASLQAHQEFLENKLMAGASGTWRLGKERFARKLELTLNAGLTADEVCAEAEREYERVVNEMYVIARQLWSRYYPKEVLPPGTATGRQAAIQKVLEQVGQEHGKPEQLVRDVRATVSRLKRFIDESDILRLPDPDRCEIIEMPEFQRGNSTAYMNSPPPLDPMATGYYAVSPPPSDWDAQRVKSYLEEYNSHMLQILTIHEAYPGHYVQFEYANKNPSLIRRVLQSGVFIEGWAVYTEQTLLDQGYGDGDLALRLTQLKFYLRAVVNALLDHKMHCQPMTDDEALQLLMKGAFQSEGEARLKVVRAKQTSCQLSTYFAGRMAHYRLRQQIQQEMGDAFDLGRYHEAVLAPGPVPVKYLPELVRERLQQPR